MNNAVLDIGLWKYSFYCLRETCKIISAGNEACEQMNRICCMMELDEKYASVILRRYVEDTGNAEGVYVIRNGQQILYSDLVKEVETKEG